MMASGCFRVHLDPLGAAPACLGLEGEALTRALRVIRPFIDHFRFRGPDEWDELDVLHARVKPSASLSDK